MRLLFVCTGNTCRSPLAQAIMKMELRKKGIDWIEVSSAGISANEGARATENARLVAKKLGSSLDRFKSSQLTLRRASNADLILTMTEQQKKEIIERWPKLESRTMTISEFTGSRRGSIADPLGGSIDVYMDCARSIKDEVKRIVKKLVSSKSCNVTLGLARSKKKRREPIGKKGQSRKQI